MPANPAPASCRPGSAERRAQVCILCAAQEGVGETFERTVLQAGADQPEAAGFPRTVNTAWSGRSKL